MESLSVLIPALRERPESALTRGEDPMANPGGKLAEELEKQIAELEKVSDSVASREEIDRLRWQLEATRDSSEDTEKDAWARVLLARHPRRPYTLDYIGAEERGQAEAIAYNLKEIPKLPVPIIVVIHGEGGSGGALAIAIGDTVLMHENAVYSVISPESCSSILWRDWDHKQDAARIMKLTAEDLHGFKIVDQIVPEPPGGAHNDPKRAADLLLPVLRESLNELEALSTSDLLASFPPTTRKAPSNGPSRT